jgi:glycosyltransferase involved in cell wall biosynthesis
MKDLNPDLLIAHCELPEIYIALTPRRRSKIIVVEHTSIPWKGRRILGRIVRVLLNLKAAKWVTVNSNETRCWMADTPAHYIPNPVELPLQLSLATKSDSSDVAFVGRLTDDKRPIWAIQSALANNLNIKVFGSGPMLEPLRKTYTTHTEFFGFVQNPWNHISHQTLIVVPSKYEGDGLVVVEAILRGNPLLLFDSQDFRRFCLPDNHYFSDLTDLTQKINCAKNLNFEDYIPPAALREKLKSDRELANIVNQWEALIRESVSGN